MVRTYKTESGLTVTLGENAKENDRIRKYASQKDFWFHLENVASPHVILSVGKGAPSRDDVNDCAQLVKQFSKQKGMDRSSVIYTNVNKVKKVPEVDGLCQLACTPEKLVVYTNEDSLKRLMSTEVKVK